MNALEACHSFQVPVQQCLLVLMADHKSLPQLLSLIDKTPGWAGILPLVNVGLNPTVADWSNGGHERHAIWGNDAFGIIKLRSLSRSLNKLDYVFLGDLGNVMMRHFANVAEPSEIVALDDGTATLQYAAWRNQNTWGKKKRFSKVLGLWGKRLLLGVRDRVPDHLTFFSVYDVELPPQDRWAKNSFDDLRSRAADLDAEDRIYFLGGPLVEAKILSEDEYVWHLQKVAGFFAGTKVTYVAHRREHWERVERIGQLLGWDVRLFDFPIEFQLAVVGPRPRTLAAFFSSALENCRTVFGDLLEIYSFRLSADHFAQESTRGESVRTVYNRYTSLSGEYFHIVDVQDYADSSA